MREKLLPAYSIVSRLGGVNATAHVCSVHFTRVYSWMKSKERGGTGGTIPQWHHPAILKFSEANELGVTADDFVQRTESAA